LNVVDNGADPRFLLSLVKTLRQDFSVVEVWAETGELGAEGRVTFVVLASERPSGADRLVAKKGLQRSWERWESAALSVRVADSDGPVLTDDYAPVDRLMASLLLHEDP
jgi:hypothetical protein